MKHPILIPYLKRITGDDILNVGGRNDELAELFQGKNYQTLDINPEANPDIVGSAYEIPLPDKSLDAIVSIYLLEHLAEPHRFMGEARRVLRPRGQMLLMTPFIHPYHGGMNAGMYCPDYYRFTKDGLAFLFTGFSRVTIESDGGFFYALGSFFGHQKFFSFLDRLYPNGLSRHAYIVHAVL